MRNYDATWALLLITLVSIIPVARGQSGPIERSGQSAGAIASRLLPDTVVLFAEVPAPGGLVDLLLSHPLRERLEAMPVYRAAWQSDGLMQLKAGISIFEAGLGKRWPRAVSELTAGGVCFAIDGQSQGFVVFMQARDERVIDELREAVFSLMRTNKPAGSDGDPIIEGTYRDVTAYSIRNDIRVAALGSLLVVTNKADLGKAIIDRYLDGSDGSLSSNERFNDAYAERSLESTAWGYMDIKQFRDSGAARDLYSGRTDNFIAELLLGGILSNLRSTPYATASLAVESLGTGLQIATPHDVDWVGEDRAYYFGPDGEARAPELLRLEDQLFALSAYRDMSEAWLRAGDLMTEKANDQLAQADTQLTTFFSGRDFGEDILGSIGPDIQIVAIQQDFDHTHPIPAIKLPAFALKIQMREPDKTRPELRRVFQSFIGFLNVVGAMEGNPQFDLAERSDGNSQIVSATYVAEQDDQNSTAAAINFNFSPTVAFVGDHLFISSTKQLAEALMAKVSTNSGSGEAATTSLAGNTIAKLQAGALRAILEENRGQLVAQNMLEKGHSREEAEGEIGVLLKLLEFLQQASFKLQATPSQLSVHLDLELAEID